LLQVGGFGAAVVAACCIEGQSGLGSKARLQLTKRRVVDPDESDVWKFQVDRGPEADGDE